MPNVILLNVRCYSRYALSYQDLKERMLERGVQVDHTTIFRWVQAYAPELDKRIRPHLNSTKDSWKVVKTYIKVKGTWKHLYRALIVRATPWTSCSAPNETQEQRNDSLRKSSKALGV